MHLFDNIIAFFLTLEAQFKDSSLWRVSFEGKMKADSDGSQRTYLTVVFRVILHRDRPVAVYNFVEMELGC